jgi:hypothetical protein
VVILSTRLDPDHLKNAPRAVRVADMEAIKTRGFVPGLQAQGPPVRVLHPVRYVDDDNEAVRDRDMNSLANADTGIIVVTYAVLLHGLECRVVVSVADRVVPMEGLSVAQQELADNIRMWSRCTTQLIIVDFPHHDSSDHNNDDSTTAPGVLATTMLWKLFEL